MIRVVLIQCASKKTLCKSKASELYTSTVFLYGRKYIETIHPDKWFILSAKYGLLCPDTVIEPYNVTLNKMRSGERIEWARKVLVGLNQHADPRKDHFIILAGKNYREHLLQYLHSYEIPMANLAIGKQLQFLKKNCVDFLEI